MSSTLKRILSFGVLEAGGRGFSWLLMALLPLFLEPAEYGLIGLIAALEFVLTTTMMVGQDRVVMRFFHDGDIDPRSLLATSSAVVSATAFVFLCSTLVIAAVGVHSLLRIQVVPELVLLALLVLTGQLSRIAISFARVESNPALFAIHRLGLAVLKLALVLVGVIVFGGAIWYLIGASLATVIMLAAGAPFLRGRIGRVDWRLLKTSIAFGWPFVFHAVSAGLLTFADRYMIDYYIGTSAVGIYTLSYSIGASVMFVIATLTVYIEPQVYKAGTGSEASERWLARLGASCGFLASIVGICLVIGSRPVIGLKLNPEYSEALAYIPILIAAHLIVVIFLQSSFRLTMQNRTGMIAICSGAAAIVNIVLNMLMIPKYGIMGAAVATFVSYLFLALASHFTSINRQNINLPAKATILVGVIVVGSTVVAFTSSVEAACLAFAGLMLCIGALYRNEASSLWATRVRVIQ